MLITLGLILLILIMVVGGDRGVVSLIALCGNLLILSLAIWLMASGVPVLLVTVCVGVVISCITLFYQNGSNGKTWSAFLATMITMLLLFFFIYIVVWRSEAGGLNEIQQVGEDVFYYNMNLNISMRNVAVSVILLSTLGAVLDMALTVTTSVYEVKSHKENMTFKDKNKKKCLSRLIHIHINMKNTVRTFLFYPGINTRVSKYNKTKLIDIFLKIATFP